MVSTGTEGSACLLMKLAQGKVGSSPFSADSDKELKRKIVDHLEAAGYSLGRCFLDRRDARIKYRFLGVSLRVAGEPRSWARAFLSWSACLPWGQNAAAAITVQAEEEPPFPVRLVQLDEAQHGEAY